MNIAGAALLVALGPLLGGRVGEPSGESAHQVTPAAVRLRVGSADWQQVQFDAARFDSVTANALREILDTAAERGLPTAPLINRALEGAARKVNGARILMVVREYSAALEQARTMLGFQSTVQELEAGASALRAGIDAIVVASVRATRPRGGADVPLMVLTDIVKRGVPTGTARDAVNSIARMPKSDDALLGLQSTVAKNAVRGPGMAVDALHRYVRITVPAIGPPSAPATLDRKPIRPPPP